MSTNVLHILQILNTSQSPFNRKIMGVSSCSAKFSLFITAQCDKFLPMQGIGTSSVNLSEITTFIFDLDGVLWRGDTAIEGAVAAVKKLREAGKRCLFCTNNSSSTPAHYVEKLDSMGLHVNEPDVLTSSWVTAHYLSGHFTGPFLAYVIGEEGIYSSLQKIGAHIVPDSDLDSTQSVDCVVVGIDREFNYKKLHHAQRLIQNGALFIATNRDGSYPVEDGVKPGAGSIVAAVEAASGTTPVTVGKPRPVMVDLAIQKLNLRPEEVAFVGDRLDTDIACARRAGVTAICVLTGVTSEEKAVRARGELRPHYIYATLTDLCKEALAPSPAITSAPPEEAVTQAETPEESTFTIPDEDTFEIASAPAVEDNTPEAPTADDIDQLFEESNEQPETNSLDEDKNFDLDTAMSVAVESEPELPESQKPASADEEPTSSSESTFDLDKAMSTTSSEEAKPPSQTAEAEAKKEKADGESFDWKLD
jgi:4-nitrophenyl phosphatase